MAVFKIYFGQLPPPVILYMRPDADSVDGGWTNEVDSNVNLFASIDETTASDSDYIKSASTPSADICRLSLSDPGGAITTPMILNYRYKKTGSGQIDLTVRLLEGSTPVAIFTHTNISSSYVDASQTVAPSPAIGDPNNLFIEFEANKP